LLNDQWVLGEIKEEIKRFLERGWREREGAEWVVREGVGAGGRNDPSLVCTYE
jgi:hypothetical protein